MVRFGVAGYPPAFSESPYKRDRLKIINWLVDIGLNALELQMTYGPRTRPDKCREYRDLATYHDVLLSVHASYFIVLTSTDARKLENSFDTLKRTFELCSILDAKTIVLHPGPLYGENPQVVLSRFIENLGECMHQIGSSRTGLFVETAGKRGQLGSLTEILEICSSVPNVFPCIDFGHIHARTGGTLRTGKDIDSIFDQLLKAGYLTTPGRVHFHYTPIDYGPKGELKHKSISDTYPEDGQMALQLTKFTDLDRNSETLYLPRPEPVSKALKKYDVNCTVISETYNSQEIGALELRRLFKEL